MLPPVCWPGSSNPSGTNHAPARSSGPQQRLPHQASLHPAAELNHARRRSVIPDTRWYVAAMDAVRPETIGVRSTPARHGRSPCRAGWHRLRRAGHRAASDVRQDQQAPFFAALERARATAYPVGEYVGQESFMRAGEVRTLAQQARIGPGVSVLDLCCGVAGPGRMITAESGCRYLGVDQSVGALATARQLAGNLPCRFEHAHLPPLPEGRFEVVFLLETMLAFPDKDALTGEVARVLEPGGRFAFTMEEGRPLTQPERARMPGADTVWPIELAELTGLLRNAGLTVLWRQEYSSSHHAIATALHRCYRADSAQIAGQIGTQATAELITAHQLWSDWLGSGRVRKFAVVAEKQ